MYIHLDHCMSMDEIYSWLEVWGPSGPRLLAGGCVTHTDKKKYQTPPPSHHPPIRSFCHQRTENVVQVLRHFSKCFSINACRVDADPAKSILFKHRLPTQLEKHQISCTTIDPWSAGFEVLGLEIVWNSSWITVQTNLVKMKMYCGKDGRWG